MSNSNNDQLYKNNVGSASLNSIIATVMDQRVSLTKPEFRCEIFIALSKYGYEASISSSRMKIVSKTYKTEERFVSERSMNRRIY